MLIKMKTAQNEKTEAKGVEGDYWNVLLLFSNYLPS